MRAETIPVGGMLPANQLVGGEKQNIMPSSEIELLSCCADIDPGATQLQKLRGCLSNGLDMERLTHRAALEGLGGFLYKNLLKAGLLESASPRDRRQLYTLYYLTVRNNIRRMHALNIILDSLNREGIDIVLLQGMALLQGIYRDVGLRSMRDIDLWVMPRDYQILVDTLLRLKFSRDPLYPNTFRKGETVLDVHTHILWADRIKSRAHLLTTDQEDIFCQAAAVSVDGRKALILNPQDQFIYLGLHALKHNFERLIWLVDIKSLVSAWTPADWAALVVRAEALGHQMTLRYLLYLQKNIFDVRLPAGISAFLKDWQPRFWEKRMLHRRINGRPIPTWAQLIMMSSSRGFGKKMNFFRETLFPRPEILRQVFAHSPGLGLVQLYWRRMLQMIGSGKPF